MGLENPKNILFYKENTMKKIVSIAALLLAFSATANAHHNAGSDNAGDTIPDQSGHLDLVL